MKSMIDDYRYSAADLPQPEHKILYGYRCIMKLILFFLFGTGSLALGIVLFPLMRLFLHPKEKFKKYARLVVSYNFRFFIIIMRIFRVIKIKVDDRKAYRKLSSCIIVANHPSLIDVVHLIALIPNADCIVRGGLTKTPVAAIIRQLYIVNSLDYRELLDLSCQSLKEGNCLIIFPEGTRTPRHGTNPYKRGAARIAIESGCNVQPVYIGGNDKYGLGKHDAFISYNRKECYLYDIQLLPEIKVADYKDMEPQIAARKLTEKMHARISGAAFIKDNRIL